MALGASGISWKISRTWHRVLRDDNMVHPSLKPLVAALITATPFCLCSLGVRALEPIEALGKNIFFDDTLSIPSNKQACASCHDPAKGWILPNSAINSAVT